MKYRSLAITDIDKQQLYVQEKATEEVIEDNFADIEDAADEEYDSFEENEAEELEQVSKVSELQENINLLGKQLKEFEVLEEENLMDDSPLDLTSDGEDHGDKKLTVDSKDMVVPDEGEFKEELGEDEFETLSEENIIDENIETESVFPAISATESLGTSAVEEEELEDKKQQSGQQLYEGTSLG